MLIAQSSGLTTGECKPEIKWAGNQEAVTFLG
jgi:hypothetical protein